MKDFLAYLADTAPAFKITAEEINLPTILATDTIFNQIVSSVYVVLAAIAVVMIVRAALLYVTNGDDPNSVKQARETIIYASIALVGSTAVFWAIQFVIKSLL